MNNIRVIVLKADNTNSKVIDVLTKNNFIINVCNTTSEFLNYIHNNLYDLYFIEINEDLLSRLELVELLEKTKNITPKIAIVPNINMIKTSFSNNFDECIINTMDENEILLRIKAIIRRQFSVYSDSIFLKNNIEYEIFNKRILINKNEINLGKFPTSILAHLLKFKNIFVSSENIESYIYQTNSNCKNGVIRLYIHKIRKYLGEDLIICSRSCGYQLVLN